MSAGIEVVNVTKQYNIYPRNKINALRGISLTIKKGEYVGLLGMNGSGKSTLARLFNGLLKPTEGKVYINGLDTADPANLHEIRRMVGMVFQNPDNQLVCPVVEEEIAFGPENMELPWQEIRRRVDWSPQVAVWRIRDITRPIFYQADKNKWWHWLLSWLCCLSIWFWMNLLPCWIPKAAGHCSNSSIC